MIPSMRALLFTWVLLIQFYDSFGIYVGKGFNLFVDSTLLSCKYSSAFITALRSLSCLRRSPLNMFLCLNYRTAQSQLPAMGAPLICSSAFITALLSLSCLRWAHPKHIPLPSLFFIIFIIIIIIKKGRQCKAEREWYTSYQSEDPNSTIPTYRQKEEKGKKKDYSRDRAA